MVMYVSVDYLVAMGNAVWDHGPVVGDRCDYRASWGHGVASSGVTGGLTGGVKGSIWSYMVAYGRIW